METTAKLAMVRLSANTAIRTVSLLAIVLAWTSSDLVLSGSRMALGQQQGAPVIGMKKIHWEMTPQQVAEIYDAQLPWVSSDKDSLEDGLYLGVGEVRAAFASFRGECTYHFEPKTDRLRRVVCALKYIRASNRDSTRAELTDVLTKKLGYGKPHSDSPKNHHRFRIAFEGKTGRIVLVSVKSRKENLIVYINHP